MRLCKKLSQVPFFITFVFLVTLLTQVPALLMICWQLHVQKQSCCSISHPVTETFLLTFDLTDHGNVMVFGS